MSWFDQVTGSNEYERQSWRDSFNGGMAAGDWTGNTNARLAAERDAFQGATWSGSSTQPSALQLAKSMVGTGPALGAVASGHGSSGTGPGNGVVATAPTVPTQGPGNGVVTTAPTVPTQGPGRRVVVGPSSVTSVYAGGNEYPIDRGWSDAADAEDRWGEAELFSPSWFYNWGVWGADTLRGVQSWLETPDNPQRTRGMLEALPTAPEPWLRDAIGGIGRGFVIGAPITDEDLPNPFDYRPASSW